MVTILPEFGSVSGRIGKGFGKGLAEQLPKEVDRYRLASGLQDLSNNSKNMTPLQQFAAYSAIPGITPSMVQALPEILKQENIRSAYQKRSGNTESIDEPRMQGKPGLDSVKFAEQPGSIPRPRSQGRPSDFVNEDEKSKSEVGLSERNPTSPELTPRKPWTKDRKAQEVSQIFEEIPGISLNEAMQLANENEQREIAQPVAEQAIDQRLIQIQNDADKEFDRQLLTKLQKPDMTAAYADLPGELQLSLKKGMARDLKTDSNATIRSVADKWSEIGLNQAKALTSYDKVANKPFFENKPETTLKQLMTLQKPFAKAGNKEAYQNHLVTDMDFSPQRAAQIAYPATEKISSYITSDVKRSPAIPDKFKANSRKYAKDISKIITAEDSLLTIARSIKDKDAYFDERSFWDQLREDLDDLPLTPRQQREIGTGESSILPKWADLWYFPWPTGIKTGSVKS